MHAACVVHACVRCILFGFSLDAFFLISLARCYLPTYRRQHYTQWHTNHSPTAAAAAAAARISHRSTQTIIEMNAVDGGAVYFPCVIFYLAYASGNSSALTFSTVVTLVLTSTLGAVGASPVPSASLVMVVMVWSAVFPSIDLPAEFAYVQAVDWLLDRFRTTVNVVGDTSVCAIIATRVAASGAKAVFDDEERRTVMKEGRPGSILTIAERASMAMAQSLASADEGAGNQKM
jgi:hypothetical protein